MHRESFENLCSMLPGRKKADTNLRQAIPLPKRVAVALYSLGSSAEYRTIANLFGIGKSTACCILLEFCEEAWRILRPLHFNHFPLTREKIEECVRGFDVLGFPQCLGAIGNYLCFKHSMPHTILASVYKMRILTGI